MGRVALLLAPLVLILHLSVHLTTAAVVRLPNSTLRLPQSLPLLAYSATNAFGDLTFTNPVCIVTPPGETNRLFVLEKGGLVVVITNLAQPRRTVFMDIRDRVYTYDQVYAEPGLLGLAFHPGYATNRFFYLFYVGFAATTAHGIVRHEILSRFETSPTNPNLGLVNSESVLLAQLDEEDYHNAGSLVFGLDGYLYASLGDEGLQTDLLGNCQNISNDFFSGIIRIDVDRKPGSLLPNSHPGVTTNYAIPPDNPFVGLTNFNDYAVATNKVRTEFWAVGLRNPWRMSMDDQTGALYVGDVGQAEREEINLVRKGANYGWNYLEGNLLGPNYGAMPALAEFTPPLIDYARSEGQAVIGGVVYRGQRITQLYGSYVYGDCVSGKIWSLRHSGTNVTENTLLMVDDQNEGGVAGISAFGIDPSNGDVLYADIQNGHDGRIKRIVVNSTTNGVTLPPTLADTGAFADVKSLTPAAGVMDYEINVPFWSDGATKSRWFSVPDTNLFINFNRESNWQFPTGSVWIKHFELELTNGVPATRKRLETRFLVKNESGIYGITYRWGGSLTNASLVPDAGLDETLVINAGGVLRTQVWHYPSRVECLRCHTEQGGFALGFNTPQLNRDHAYPWEVTNQIAALNTAGYFTEPVAGRHTLPALAAMDDESVSLTYRVRSYLAANCSQCHQPGGAARGAKWDARITTPIYAAGIINGEVVGNPFGQNTRIVVPQNPGSSVLASRISSLTAGRMPPVGSNVRDSQAISLLSRWINTELAGYLSFPEYQVKYFGSTNTPVSQATADPDRDRASNWEEWITRTVPTNAASVWKLSMTGDATAARVNFLAISNLAFEVQVTAELEDAEFTWTPLDIPSNSPRFSITNRAATIKNVLEDTEANYYRVRVLSP